MVLVTFYNSRYVIVERVDDRLGRVEYVVYEFVNSNIRVEVSDVSVHSAAIKLVRIESKKKVFIPKVIREEVTRKMGTGQRARVIAPLGGGS
jgi:hypothetical protein